jgi:hypothetical protein
MRPPDRTPPQVRQHRRREWPGHISKSAFLVICGSLLWMVISLGANSAGSAVRSSGADHGTQTQTSRTPTTTGINANTVVRGHKEGTLAVVLSFIGVIAVVVLIVSLGSISVRRRTGDNPTARRPWERGPPDSRSGWFG